MKTLMEIACQMAGGAEVKSSPLKAKSKLRKWRNLMIP